MQIKSIPAKNNTDFAFSSVTVLLLKSWRSTHWSKLDVYFPPASLLLICIIASLSLKAKHEWAFTQVGSPAEINLSQWWMKYSLGNPTLTKPPSFSNHLPLYSALHSEKYNFRWALGWLFEAIN